MDGYEENLEILPYSRLYFYIFGCLVAGGCVLLNSICSDSAVHCSGIIQQKCCSTIFISTVCNTHQSTITGVFTGFNKLGKIEYIWVNFPMKDIPSKSVYNFKQSTVCDWMKKVDHGMFFFLIKSFRKKRLYEARIILSL